MYTTSCRELSKDVIQALNNKPPYLSGSLSKHLLNMSFLFNLENMTLIVDAPLYDVKNWYKTGQIRYYNAPHPKYPNITDYAMWLNDSGAFGTHNKSEHWANRGVYNGVLNYAAKLQARGEQVVIINKLPL